MKLKIYELITVSEEDGIKNVMTKLFSEKKEISNEFNSLVEETIGRLKKTYGEDGVADGLGEFEDLLDFNGIPVRYVWNKKDISFWAEDLRDPGLYEIHIWMVEHEI